MQIDLSTHQGYLIAGAIRGPDTRTSADSMLKLLTTSVLRHFVGITYFGATVNSPEDAQGLFRILSADARKAVTTAYNEPSHFMAHWCLAMTQLNTPGALAYCQWLDKQLRHHTNYMLPEYALWLAQKAPQESA